MKALPALAALALLQSAVALPTQARAGDWGGVFSALILTSDFRYQGVSNSGGHPAVQAYVHYWRPDGFYAGAFASQDDASYPGAPTYEVDSYAGKNFSLDHGRTELKAEAMYTAMPDNRTPGPTLDFFQAKLQAKHTAGPWTNTALVSYVPEGPYRSGQTWRVEGESDYALNPHLTLKALSGYQWGGRGHERSYWSLGAVTTWKTLAFELRYVGNDRTRANCGFRPKACDAAVVATLTVSLPPIL